MEVRINVHLKNMINEDQSRFTMDVPDTICVDEVLELIKQSYPEIKKIERFMTLINNKLVVSNQKLEQEDLLTVFPLFMGG